jgi:hypothetical protein
MTNFERSHSRWLDPPDPPTHWECDRCGRVWDSFYLNPDCHGYEYLCDECLEEVDAEVMEEAENE